MRNLQNLGQLLGQLGMTKAAEMNDTVQEIEDPRDTLATPGTFSSELDSRLESSSEGDVTEKSQETASEQNTNGDVSPDTEASLITDDPSVEDDFTTEEGKEDVTGDGKGGTESGITIQEAVSKDAAALSECSLEELVKMSQALKADTAPKAQSAQPATKQAAAEVVTGLVQNAMDQADMTAGYITEMLTKYAMDVAPEVAMNEDEMAEEGAVEETPVDEALLAAMAEQPEPVADGEATLDMVPPEEGLELPAAIPGGEEVAPEEALMDEDVEAALQALGQDGAIQELAAAMVENNISPEALMESAETKQDEPAKLALLADAYFQSNHFELTEAPRGSNERIARDYMKGVVREHQKRAAFRKQAAAKKNQK